MKKPLLWGALMTSVLLSVSAQDASSDFDAQTPTEATDPTAFSWGVLKYSGDQEGGWRFGAYEPATRTGGALDSTMSAEYKLGGLKVVAAGEVRDNEFVPGETAASYTLGAVKFGAGLQEFSWGVADKKNPTDTLNARDYRYDVDAPRLVNPAASVSWYPADWASFDLVYEPWKNRSKFPVNFATSTQAQLTASATALKATSAGAYLAAYNPTVTAEAVDENTTDKPVYGARANFFLPGVDLGFSYVYDWDTYYTPVVTMKQYTVLWVPETVELRLQRVHRVGLNAKTTVDRYGLWLEAAYLITQDPWGTDDAVRNSKVSWTAGLDCNFGPGSAYYANFQYAGEWVPGYDSGALTLDTNRLTDRAYMTRYTYKSLVQALGLETEALMNTFTSNVKFPLNDATVTPQLTTAVLVPVGYDASQVTRYWSADFKPELDVMPADGLHVVVGADLAYAWIKKAGSGSLSLDTSTDKLGVYTPDNNVYVKVRYRWNGTLGN